VRETGYQGGFEHPVRSFLIGIALLVLLFGGFVVGIEAGTQPSASGGTRTLTVGGQRLRVVTVQQPVVKTTVGRATTIVRLLGPGRTAAVVRDGDSTLVGYLSQQHRGRIVSSSAFREAGTIYLPSPVTVTETVTETVTQTVTDTTGTTDGGTTTGSTAP
jgi:hypothetical protein